MHYNLCVTHVIVNPVRWRNVKIDYELFESLHRMCFTDGTTNKQTLFNREQAEPSKQEMSLHYFLFP